MWRGNTNSNHPPHRKLPPSELPTPGVGPRGEAAASLCRGSASPHAELAAPSCAGPSARGGRNRRRVSVQVLSVQPPPHGSVKNLITQAMEGGLCRLHRPFSVRITFPNPPPPAGYQRSSLKSFKSPPSPPEEHRVHVQVLDVLDKSYGYCGI